MTAVTLDTIQHNEDGTTTKGSITVDPDSVEARKRKAIVAERLAARQAALLGSPALARRK